MFWSTETIRARGTELVEPFDTNKVFHGAYELAVGPEIYLTSTDGDVKQSLDIDESIGIPPGQFALLLTEETIRIPNNAIGLISMKFGIKRKGLINVSGFHVDPGYRNRLKFSVYNAGPQKVTLARGEPAFTLWFCDLDRETAFPYDRQSPNHDRITSDDQDVLSGEVSSPAQLRKELNELRDKDISELRHKVEASKGYRTLLIGVLFAIFVRLLFLPYDTRFGWIVPEAEKAKLINEITAKVLSSTDSAESAESKIYSENVEESPAEIAVQPDNNDFPSTE